MKKLIKKYSLGTYIAPDSNTLVKKIKFFEKNRNQIKLPKKNLIDLRWESQAKLLVYSYKKII